MPRDLKREWLAKASMEEWEAQFRKHWGKFYEAARIGTNFSKTSRNMKLKDGHILEAECADYSRRYRSSKLNLDDYLVLCNAGFTSGSGSLRTSPGYSIQLESDGKTLSAQLPAGKDRVFLDLDKIVGNHNGQLICTEKWDVPRCDLCNSFPRPGRTVFHARELRGPSRAPNCPSCEILETLLHHLEPKGFGSDNTMIAYADWLKSMPHVLPHIRFVCKRGESLLSEEFEIFRLKGNGFKDSPWSEYANSHEGEPSESFQFSKRFLPRGRHVSSGSASEECLSLVRKWITDCEQKHETCQQVRATTCRLPSRVLDVGKFDGDVIRLKHSEGSTGRYICLSHCWGRNPTLTLTRTNITALSRSIPTSDLQAVYRDAISFCRRLGVQYIWIDSLCIIQDDANDWAIESARMASYYGKCYICLAATSAADHDEGCSTSNQRWTFDGSGIDGLPYRVHLRKATEHIYKARHSDYFPLLKRAWVYQERRLSPRILHFCYSEVSFECNSRHACECRQKPVHQEIQEWTKPVEFHHVGHQVLINIGGDKTPVAHEWHAIVQAYADLDLKFITDRLPAMAGLAEQSRKRREVAQGSAGRYLAGLWEQDLTSDMAWCVNKDFVWAETVKKSARYKLIDTQDQRPTSKACRPRSEDYVAPSWSWASVRDPVRFSPYEFKQTLCKILHSQTELVSSSEFGQVSSGFFMIQAQLLESRCAFENRKDRFIDIKDTALFGDIIANYGMSFWPDYDIWAEGRGKVTTSEALYLMPLISRPVFGRDGDAEFRFRFWPGATKVEKIFLVLRRVGSSNIPVFERIGWSNYIGSPDIPNMSRAVDTKFMLV